ncbi:MAG: AAA family ATPase [Deltaproteobacteria bacterium]|nr:AAA family ATPase [Deltaproteobacteria bacterium]
MNSEINSIVANRTLIQTLGSGGVGKTTLSVVLGIAASRLGKKTLVVTIDPSKRLMDTLHIKGEQDIVYVKELNIHAMMIDVARSWEIILKQYASPRTFDKIVKNRFNKYLRDYLPGFDEYIVSEMIYYMMNVENYDIIIVDSPPSVYAISYLEASNRVLDVLSNDFLLSLIPYIDISSTPIKFIMKKEIFILKNIAKFTGMEMLTELIKFINDLSPLLQGFKQRADFIKRFYSSKRCGFFIVTLPNDVSFRSVEILMEYLSNHRYQVDGIFINRLCSFCGAPIICMAQSDNTESPYLVVADIKDAKLQELIQRYFVGNISLRKEIIKNVEQFLAQYKNKVNIFAVPEMAGYIKSTSDIIELLEGIRTFQRYDDHI